jgi:hypothetical protein
MGAINHIKFGRSGDIYDACEQQHADNPGVINVAATPPVYTVRTARASFMPPMPRPPSRTA